MEALTSHADTSNWVAFPRGAFRRMGWAFLFLGISIGPTIRLGQDQFVLDLLPDFVGFLMIATAANRLVPFLRDARAVRNLALGLAFLAMPAIVQYSVVTASGGNISTWKSPLWPLMVVQGILEFMLVWMLCGMVAHLARRVGDQVTEQRARSARVVYITLKIVLAIGLVWVLVFPSPYLIVFAVIAGLAIGLMLLVMIIRLMGRAERMCAERPEVDLPIASKPPGGVMFRLLAIGGVLLPIGLAGGGIFYYLDWKIAREQESLKSSTSTYFRPARNEFYEHLRADRLNDAYEVTTADFKKRISREQFDGLARRYAEYQVLQQEGVSGTGGGMSSGPDRQIEHEYIQIQKGKILQVTITIRREPDSIFFRTPPPVKVDDFSIEEKVIPQQGWPPRGR